jgi:hypothetical protein
LKRLARRFEPVRVTMLGDHPVLSFPKIDESLIPAAA